MSTNTLLRTTLADILTHWPLFTVDGPESGSDGGWDAAPRAVLALRDCPTFTPRFPLDEPDPDARPLEVQTDGDEGGGDGGWSSPPRCSSEGPENDDEPGEFLPTFDPEGDDDDESFAFGKDDDEDLIIYIPHTITQEVILCC